MPVLEKIWDDRNCTGVRIASGLILALIALLDWWTKPYVSLGFLYLFPIIFTAAFLPRWVVVLLAAGCAALAEIFSPLDPSLVRFSFEMLALAGCGLFVGELVRNRRITKEAEARLNVLIETSPAAIMTVDENGFIDLANQSAVDLLEPGDGKLVGAPVAAFLPELHHALRWEDAPRFRSSLRCNGHKGTDECFTADIWLSTYSHAGSRKLAAIVVNMAEAEASTEAVSSGEQKFALSARESEVLRWLMQGLANKEIAARMDVSESTVKNLLQHLFARTNVRTRAQLVRIAFEQFREDSMPVTVRSPVRRGASSDARRMLAAHRHTA
jgi:DNA-binding CsgD family transcriptional regulator